MINLFKRSFVFPSLTAATIAVVLAGCSGGSGSGGPNPTPVPTDPYAGTYTGTYETSNDIDGTFSLVVDNNRNAVATVAAPFVSGPVTLTGTVNNDGEFALSGTANNLIGIQFTFTNNGEITLNGNDNTINAQFTVTDNVNPSTGTSTGSEVPTNSPFTGTYTGAYTGTGGTGTITMTVSSDGEATFTAQDTNNGTIGGNAVVDLNTGRVAANAPYQSGGNQSIYFLGDLTAGTPTAGGGVYSNSAGGDGSFTLTKTN